MRISLNVTLAALAILLVACSATPSPGPVYGTWELKESLGDSLRTHPIGETMQLAPGEVARFSAPGTESRQARFHIFRGEIEYPAPGRDPEGFLVQIEGETEIFILEMPTRNTLQLVANGMSPLAFTYHRVR